jgi:hypothetical protein
MPDIWSGGSVSVFHCGWTLSGDINDTSAKVSGPTVMRVAFWASVPTNEFNTPTALIDALVEQTVTNSVEYAEMKLGVAAKAMGQVTASSTQKVAR